MNCPQCKRELDKNDMEAMILLQSSICPQCLETKMLDVNPNLMENQDDLNSTT